MLSQPQLNLNLTSTSTVSSTWKLLCTLTHTNHTHSPHTRVAHNIKFYKNHISWDSWRSIGMGISEWDEIKFINECCNGAVLMASTLYKGNFIKYKGKAGKSVFWNFRRLNIFKSCLMALVYIPEALVNLLTPILSYITVTISHAKCLKYGIFDIMTHLECDLCNSYI